MTNLDSILKSKDITLPAKVHIVTAMIFPVVVYGYDSWAIKKAECQRIDAFELFFFKLLQGFPGGSDSKESARNGGNLGSFPGSGRSLGEGNGNPLQYSCLENPMDRGAWWASVPEVTKSQT